MKGLDLYKVYQQTGEVGEILLSISIMLLAGFLLSRLTKRLRLPNVTAYILAGIVIGPQLLGLVSPAMLGHMNFISDLALAFIAFSVGKFFKKKNLKAAGAKVIVITLFQSLTAGVIVTLAVRALFGFDWKFALLLGAIATATAPASTLMTIKQYHARGEAVNIILQVVALDDVICLLTFSVVAALFGGGNSGVSAMLLPLVYNTAAIALGFSVGFLAAILLKNRSKDNRVILILAILAGISAVCGVFKVSPLLSCMAMGAAYINFSRDSLLFDEVDGFTPPLISLFFILSGASLDLNSLAVAGVVGVCYFALRILGKYLGAAAGCAVTGKKAEIREYLGLALVPQAGVAIGLAFLGARILPAATGELLMTIILSSSVLYELIGPAAAKFALIKMGCMGEANGLPLRKSKAGFGREKLYLGVRRIRQKEAAKLL